MPRIVERKPHPNSPDHEVIVFQTKVRHEMQIPKGIGTGEVMRLITRYLKGYDEETPEGKVHVKGYEDYYPETAEEAEE
ncbi:MAG: hypothetical protein QXS32_09035 [Candidatus Nezhaarchaeales archaeon]